MKRNINRVVALTLALFLGIAYVCAQKVQEVKASYGWNRAPRYRGFVGHSFMLGVGDIRNDWVSICTSHGVQINPGLFVGAGVGVNCWLIPLGVYVPIFMHLRGDWHKKVHKNVSPYVDAKVGYNIASVGSVFCNPSVGYHFYFGHSNVGLSAGVGYVVLASKDDLDKEITTIGGVTFNLALDF